MGNSSVYDMAESEVQQSLRLTASVGYVRVIGQKMANEQSLNYTP